MTDLAEVVTKAAFYFRNLFQLIQTNSLGKVSLLEDYPNCGIRNNDTFSFYDIPQYGNQATADWGAECLWDCDWIENPFVSQTYQYNDTKNDSLRFNIFVSMPKVPKDLGCLNNCTDVRLYPELSDKYLKEVVDCSKFALGSFLGCYLYYSRRNINESTFEMTFDKFISKTYFDLAVESCILAIIKHEVYPQGNCDQLGVNLRIFNPYLPSPHLSNSNPLITKLQGLGTTEVVFFGGLLGSDFPKKNRNPWLCSLRTPGFSGVHRCGVTLLSAPPHPTIFVSAAHCNYVCKNNQGRVVEICCCRDSAMDFSCKTSEFCGTGSTLQLAQPQDLQIVCNIRTQEPQPQGLPYPQTFKIIEILEIINHPNYMNLEKDQEQSTGPMSGHDISVYKVNDTNFSVSEDSIWPACLPKDNEKNIPGNQGILAGWSDPLPAYFVGDIPYRSSYVNKYLVQREALFRGQPACSDPKWMRSNTYYPAGTLCYTEAAWAGSVQFGISGSGLVRPFTSSGDGANPRYSFVGPLSMSKGSDRTFSPGNSLIDYSSNPAVFTDARCYLDWIAAQYGLVLPADYAKPATCATASGDRAAANKPNCLSRALPLENATNTPEQCLFGAGEKCVLYSVQPGLQGQDAKPSYNRNFYTCFNTQGLPAVCANDCPGVDPNAIVIGGEVALLSLAIASSSVDLVGPLLGAGVGLAGLGLGGVAMNACPCRSRLTGQCCTPQNVRGLRICPLDCS